MIKYVNSAIVMQEVPNEITLAINLSLCPNRCKGCHSPELRKDIGEELTKERLDKLIQDSEGITCICFMGGDNDKGTLHKLARYIKLHWGLKVAWYSGQEAQDNVWGFGCFNYIKYGPYIKEKGPLNNKNTNQKMLMKKVIPAIEEELEAHWDVLDITHKFWKNNGNK